jgi:hypothetical protein
MPESESGEIQLWRRAFTRMGRDANVMALA